MCGKILSIVRHLSSVLEQADIKKEDDDPLTPPKTTLTNILKSCSAQIRNDNWRIYICLGADFKNIQTTKQLNNFIWTNRKVETKMYLLPIGPKRIVWLLGCLIVFKIRSLFTFKNPCCINALIKPFCLFFVCLRVCVCVCLFVCLFVCLCACLFACLFVCLFICLFVCLFYCWSVCLSFFYCLFVCLFVGWFVCVCCLFFLSVCLCLLFVCLFVFIG